MSKKHITQSKTLWFNLAVAMLAVIAQNTALLQSYLSDGGYLIVMMLVSAGNVYLRSVTNSAVTLKRTL